MEWQGNSSDSLCFGSATCSMSPCSDGIAVIGLSLQWLCDVLQWHRNERTRFAWEWESIEKYSLGLQRKSEARRRSVQRGKGATSLGSVSGNGVAKHGKASICIHCHAMALICIVLRRLPRNGNALPNITSLRKGNEKQGQASSR